MARGRVYRRRRPDGTLSRWHAVIDTPRTAEGRRRQVTRTFDTAAQAHAWLAQMTLDHTSPAPVGPSMGDYLTRWLDGQVFLRPSTRASYRMHLDRYLIPALGVTLVTEVSPVQVERLVHDLAARGLAPGTINRVLATLRSAMAHAVRTGLIPVSPVAGIRVPAAVERPIRTWTPDEAARFLDHLPDDGMGMLWRLLLVTGMRRGEALALRWTHVNLVAAQVRIEASRVAVGAVVVEGRPKSAAGVRTVFLDPDSVVRLRAWKAFQGGDAGYVCTDADGRPIVPWRASTAFQQQCQELGLPRIRLHDLRHTSATLGLAAGESLKEVSQRLGHADIGITADVYADVQPATARASAERRAALMGETAGRLIMKRRAS